MFLCDNQSKFQRFSIFNFETNFLENKKVFKKLYRFLVEATKIENTSFPFKTALSANVKTNRIATTKRTYHKEWSCASNYFIFLENLFQCQNLKRLKVLIWCSNDPNVHIHIFRKCWSLILGCFFTVSILNQNQTVLCFALFCS